MASVSDLKPNEKLQHRREIESAVMLTELMGKVIMDTNLLPIYCKAYTPSEELLKWTKITGDNLKAELKSFVPKKNAYFLGRDIKQNMWRTLKLESDELDCMREKSVGKIAAYILEKEAWIKAPKLLGEEMSTQIRADEDALADQIAELFVLDSQVYVGGKEEFNFNLLIELESGVIRQERSGGSRIKTNPGRVFRKTKVKWGGYVNEKKGGILIFVCF